MELCSDVKSEWHLVCSDCFLKNAAELHCGKHGNSEKSVDRRYRKFLAAGNLCGSAQCKQMQFECLFYRYPKDPLKARLEISQPGVNKTLKYFGADALRQAYMEAHRLCREIWETTVEQRIVAAWNDWGYLELPGEK